MIFPFYPYMEVSIVMGVPLYRWMDGFTEKPKQIAGWELGVPPWRTPHIYVCVCELILS